MISQALINLIKNAGEAIEPMLENPPRAEFQAEIRISVMQKDDQTEIRITDNGIGLPENRARLFEPYVTNRDKGTGLGLSIVKKIIEEHGGTLELQDAPVFRNCDHKGAEAVIILPKTALEKPKSEKKKVA